MAWEVPTALEGRSIKFLATPGCVKPPTVSLVDAIVKLASPVIRSMIHDYNESIATHYILLYTYLCHVSNDAH